MKKSRLDIEYDFDFELLGIHSSARGYKLAWEINQALGIQLVKQPDLVVGFKKRCIKACYGRGATLPVLQPVPVFL